MVQGELTYSLYADECRYPHYFSCIVAVITPVYAFQECLFTDTPHNTLFQATGFFSHITAADRRE